MQKFYAERETSGPEFDDCLIRLVKANPAIYDVNHPHYRRNPVRVAIWDRIASELGAPSKFIQTKWKNIRYNYLQELKCLETGFPNANIRKRRFTEDLSFLQNTAQSYNVAKKSLGKNSSYNSSDNESNSYMYPDPTGDAYEIIEIDHSDDGGDGENRGGGGGGESPENTSSNDDCGKILKKKKKIPHHAEKKMNASSVSIKTNESAGEPKPDVTIEHTFSRKKSPNPSEFSVPPAEQQHHSADEENFYSNSSSPLLTPLVILGNGLENESNGICDEVTIEPIIKSKQHPKRLSPVTPAGAAAIPTKRMSLAASYTDAMAMNDPIKLYCLSMVDSLKSMPRSERERVKFEFAKILKDAKYKDQS